MIHLLVLHLYTFNKIGVQPWCNVDDEVGTIQCNYESKEVCEAYTIGKEWCIENWEFKK